MNERRFAFEGTDLAGNEKNGVIEADSEREAQALLRQSGISVTTLKERRTPAVESPAHANTSRMPPPNNDPSRPIRVTVVDFDMDFATMVWFMIKWTVAAIPAAIFLGFVVLAFAMLFGLLTQI